ncbi:phosphoribosylformimino-5-aminoimidazole carboxamide ribotide isomerase [Coraliomargarita sinensis]|uniref:Phosphoribosylformimino-5-aminoimidazole carboxamide ribotide isomerase n=1 Tax=Coraliomargarita sinensis TaxID=2174842 RepID=A0A317ZFQ2_9BACT|nr:phosphoribosylformimino-5-aminoimidazole carboxamide ribotide isomerase [Coraliomargarita sinensis]PXA03702.1 phosphoribosylformimino-5-aminoimidazole carboxamide ribotide isomerase [Coraliomargarita sinensis]
MTRFRPCIDLHRGAVKQIVGSSLKDDGSAPQTNFESDQPAAFFADLYRKDGLTGGHVIQLGPGNGEAAAQALAAYPGGLQIGGGITPENATQWLQLGASHVIVTSWLFDKDGYFSLDRLNRLVAEVGAGQLVIDLSCRAKNGGWVVAMDRWQKETDLWLNPETLRQLSQVCAEFLIHAADVEGKCEGIDPDLVAFLGEHSPVPCTYAGGARSLDDLEQVQTLSRGRVDLTIGSALDIFGGTQVAYRDCLAWNRGG